MSNILNKAIDLLTKQTQKISQALIVIFIFSAFFPNEAIKVKNILSDKLQIILPESFIELLQKLHISQQSLLTLWSFLLVIFGITVVIDIINQLLKGDNHITLGIGGEMLFDLNCIFLLSILIYNTIYRPGIEISADRFTGYTFLVMLSAFLFAAVFFMTYCTDFILIILKITNSDFSMLIKVFLSILYFNIVSVILTEFMSILFR